LLRKNERGASYPKGFTDLSTGKNQEKQNMAYQDTIEEITSYRLQISELRNKMRELQSAIEPEIIQDYEFSTLSGTVKLSDLFADKNTLFIVHNMGTGCPYCTLWADGFNGILGHLEDRAAFVMSTPDAPDKQQRFAESRDWKFRMISHQGTTFAEDMGYKGEDHWLPGVSVFQKLNGQVVRVSDASFGPGDDFCSIWQFCDLLPEGADGWQPKFKY